MQASQPSLSRRGWAAAALLAFSSTLPAQLSQRFIPGTAIGQQFGFAVTQLGDLDGDGIPEWAASAPFNGPANQRQRGAVFVYRGGANSSLFNLFGDRAFEIFGVSIGNAGDVDNDGTDDIIVGSSEDDRMGRNTGIVKVFSGRTRLLIRLIQGAGPFTPEARFGRSVEGMGDVDGDGFGDVAIGSMGNSRVQLVSGAANSSLGVATVGSAGALGGESIVRVGDLDGDGITELAVAAPAAAGGGEVRILRGGLVNGLRLRLLERIAVAGSQRFGTALELIEDVDRDGVPELAIGDPNAQGGSGRLHIYSLSRRAIISSFDLLGPNGGRSIAQAADVDLDGVRDLWVGGTDRVRRISSRTGAVSESLAGSGDYGRSLATVTTSAGRAEIIAGTPLADNGAATDGGGVRVLSYRAQGGFRRLGPQCPNSAGLSSVSASRVRIDETAQLGVTNAPLSSRVVLALGSEVQTPLPLDAIGMPSCFLYVQPWVTFTGITDSYGEFVFDLPLPDEPALVDAFFAFQFFAPDIVNPLGLIATQAAVAQIGLD